MKLFKFGAQSQEKCGVAFGEINSDATHYDVSHIISDYDEKFFQSTDLRELEEKLLSQRNTLKPIPQNTRIGSPIARPSKIVCIGLNYTDHALETGSKPPAEPIIFLKATSSMIGPFDNVVIPRNSTKTDWEVELGVVISKKASYVTEQEAMNYVAGYVLHNDFSEREFQLEKGGTWDKGKGCDTFAPIGPYLVTKDDIKDVNNLRLWLKVNGETVQDGNTKNLIFNIPFLISYVSQFMSLLPGDVISTGTPAGVGLGMKPPRFLVKGDVVELGIDGLGVSRQELWSAELPVLS